MTKLKGGKQDLSINLLKGAPAPAVSSARDVVGLAGMELMFFIPARKVQCFRFVMEAVLITMTSTC